MSPHDSSGAPAPERAAALQPNRLVSTTTAGPTATAASSASGDDRP